MSWTVFVAEQWLLVSLLLILVTALIVVEGKKGGKSINFHQVTRLLNDDEAILLDVRESKEFNTGHIVNAINIPFGKLAARITELEKHKSKTVIVADKMGQHSGSCGKTLKDNGYNPVRLQGGMTEWNAQNLPVVKG